MCCWPSNRRALSIATAARAVSWRTRATSCWSYRRPEGPIASVIVPSGRPRATIATSSGASGWSTASDVDPLDEGGPALRLDVRGGHGLGAAVGARHRDGAKVGEGGYQKVGEAFEALIHPERRIERLADLGRHPEAALGAHPRRDVGHEDADADHLAVVTDRIPVGEQVALDARVGRRRAGHLDLGDRLLAVDHAAEHPEHLLGQLRQQLRRAHADVRVLGQPVELRQGLVDADVAHLEVEHREAQRRAGDDGVEQLTRPTQLVGGDLCLLLRRWVAPGPRRPPSSRWRSRSHRGRPRRDEAPPPRSSRRPGPGRGRRRWPRSAPATRASRRPRPPRR